MNLIEAIKSGRPFFRKSHAHHGEDPYRDGLAWLRSFQLEECNNSHLVVDDILADDWEIQEPTVTLTRIQFFAAVERLNFTEKGPRNSVDYVALARELGLGGEKP